MQAGLESLLALFTRLKVPVAAEKVKGPSTRLTFLGIEVDTSSMSLRLPSKKLNSLKSMVANWLHKKSCRIQDLQSLVGKLQHASKVVHPGRTFLCKLFELIKGRPRGLQFVRLGMPFRLDLRWCHIFLDSWNGTGLLQGQRLGPADFNLFTDASGSFGTGAWFNEYWFQLPWPQAVAVKWSIAAKQLASVVIAVAVWGQLWQRKTVLVLSDNQAVVEVINAGACKDPLLMQHIRCICSLSQLILRLQ